LETIATELTAEPLVHSVAELESCTRISSHPALHTPESHPLISKTPAALELPATVQRTIEIGVAVSTPKATIATATAESATAVEPTIEAATHGSALQYRGAR
jgi:hypothetical protein